MFDKKTPNFLRPRKKRLFRDIPAKYTTEAKSLRPEKGATFSRVRSDVNTASIL